MANIPDGDKKILEEIDYLTDRYFAFDEPVPFCGLTIYPVQVKNYNEFMSSISCLLLNKNDDPMGIRYTNLDYLLSKIQDEKEGPMWSMKLSKLVELCFHVKPGMKCKRCGKVIPYDIYIARIQSVKDDDDAEKINKCCEDECDGELVAALNVKKDRDTDKNVLVVDGHDIVYSDFNRLRKIILYQNLSDYKDDSWVDKAIRDDQRMRNEIESKDSGSASIERKIVCMMATTSYKLEDLTNMSIRKFNQLISAVNDIIEYKITKTGLMGGMVKLEKGKTIEHWLYKKDKGLYGSAVDADGLIDKINSL